VIANNAQLAKVLSKNETLYHYSESLAEFFTNLIRDILDEIKTGAPLQEVVDKHRDVAKKRSVKISDIVGNPQVLRMYTFIYPLREYYSEVRSFQPVFFRSNIMGHHGSVSGIANYSV
jgi:hypothetical protein